jgi:ABC-type transport system involved in multi-copper enzyme maturation permease subunit
LPGTLRSEFTKIRSVRSTWITLAAFFVAGLAFAIAAAAGNRSNAGQASFDPTATSLEGAASFGELIIVVIGALVITSEFGTRMMGTSLAAMPRRGVLYAAKAIAVTCVTLVVALVTSFALPVIAVMQEDPAGLSEGQQLTVYRIVQEALTNTLKHAALCCRRGYGRPG